MTTKGGEPAAVADMATEIGGGYCNELLKMFKRREMTLDELNAECAKLVLEHIDDMRFRPYPTKTALIKELCNMSERERARQLEEKATVREREEVRQYCENWSRVWSMNYANYHSLVGKDDDKGIQEMLEDPADKAAVADFVEENFEPLKLKVFCKPFDLDPTAGPGRRWSGYTDVFIVGAVIAIQGGLFT
jgi:hypothetical protein